MEYSIEDGDKIDLRRLDMEEMRENVVLCGANSYEQKYYFNSEFKGLPEQIQKELHIMCVLFTEDIGGVITLEFEPNGTLEFKDRLYADWRKYAEEYAQKLSEHIGRHLELLGCPRL